MSLKENALQDTRVERVSESTEGEPPTDPSWKTFGDYILSMPEWTPDPQTSSFTPVGQGDPDRMDRGAEEHQIAVEYLMQRFFLDSSDNAQDPIGELITHDFQTSYPTETVVARRETTSGGNDGAGVRSYTVARGARPAVGEIPADPSESQPIPLRIQYEAEWARGFVIHQPSSSTTLDLVSTDNNDTFDVVIENEGASTTETKTLSGTTTVTTTSSFGGIDAIWAKSEPKGNITVTDGSGTTILETTDGKGGLTGSNTLGNDGERGVPPLGAGSHAADIGTDPGTRTGRSVTSTFAGSAIADQIREKGLTIEMGVNRDAQEGTDKQAIDMGPRTADVDFTTTGEYDSHTQIERGLLGASGDVVLTFPDGTVTVKSAEFESLPERQFSGEDASIENSHTLRGLGDPSVTATNTT